MVIKKPSPKGKPRGKSGKKAQRGRIKAQNPVKKPEPKKQPVLPVPVALEPVRILSPVRERYIVTVENIRGDTVIGDLLVAFPRTREVLVRKGMRLEAEDAGDIYMTIDAFSAMNGIKMESFVEELVETAKVPAPQPIAQLAAPPAT